MQRPCAVSVEQAFDLTSAHVCTAEAALVAYLDGLGGALQPPLPGARLWAELVRAYRPAQGRARIRLPHPLRLRLCSLPADRCFGDDGLFWVRAADPAYRQDDAAGLCFRGALELRLTEPRFWRPGPDLGTHDGRFLERTPGVACAAIIALPALHLITRKTTTTTTTTTPQQPGPKMKASSLRNVREAVVGTLTSLLQFDNDF